MNYAYLLYVICHVGIVLIFLSFELSNLLLTNFFFNTTV